MGINTSGAAFLLEAKARGVSFARTLMVGRQSLIADDRTWANLLPRFGITEFDTNDLHGFAEPFFALLGAQRTESVDASGFEGADYVHDMNLPLSARLHQQFDAVVDGGTLEHIFNFPIAMKNCMEAVKVGGHLLLITPANNQFGHGFYQFSPELFWRTLSPENGFVVERMLAREMQDFGYHAFGETRHAEENSPWYEVADPARIGGRVLLCNSRPVMLYVLARRISAAPIFASAPQQSDYLPQWERGQKQLGQPVKQPGQPAEAGWLRAPENGLKAALRRLVYATPLRWLWQGFLLVKRPPWTALVGEYRRVSWNNRRFFRRTELNAPLRPKVAGHSRHLGAGQHAVELDDLGHQAAE